MATRPHLVKIVTKDGESAGDNSGLNRPSVGDQTTQNLTPTISSHAGPKASKKLLAIIVAISIVVPSMAAVWALYLRPWSMHEVEAKVIPDPTLDTPGFSHALAGKTVTVEGRITTIESRETSKGELMRVWLQGSDNISLVYWGPQIYKVGDHIRQQVHFEWTNLNSERHVCSPQLDFPWIVFIWNGQVVGSVSMVAGEVLDLQEIGAQQVRITIFDQYPLVRTADADCTFSAGDYSFLKDYTEALRFGQYGHKLDGITNLSNPTSQNGSISFTDADHDGNLSAGDWFDISGITRPAAAGGVNTYLFAVGRPDAELEYERMVGICYFAVMHQGVVIMPSEIPYARMAMSNDTAGAVKATIVKMSTPASWSNITIMLSLDFNECRWYPSAVDLRLSSEEPLGAGDVGALSVSCTVGDESKNGFADEGDWIMLSVNGGAFPSSSNCTLTLLWEPMGTQLCFSTFHG